MITKWKLKNFKSVRDSTDLTLAPLTIFAGSNSSGKSTILQSIILINQTLSSYITSRSVVLNGHIEKLGQFDDLKSYGNENNEILIGWELFPKKDKNIYYHPLISFIKGERSSSQKEIQSIICEFAFDAYSDDKKSNFQLQPRLIYNYLKWNYVEEGNKLSQDIKITLSPNKDEKLNEYHVDADDESFIGALDYDVDIDPISQKILNFEFPSSKPIGVSLRHFLPIRLLAKYDHNDLIARHISSSISLVLRPEPSDYFITRDSEQLNTTIVPKKVIYLVGSLLGNVFMKKINEKNEDSYTIKDITEIIESIEPRKRLNWNKSEIQNLKDSIIKNLKEDSEVDQRINYSHLSPISNISKYVEQYFSSTIKYLGPLRDEPRSLYPLSPSINPYDIGIRGEHTAAVYDLYNKKDVEYIPSDEFNTKLLNPQKITASLKLAICDWLTYLGVAKDIITEDRGKFGHELKVITEDLAKKQDLTHVGVGVSQVFPILVMCLLAETDSTIIIEQPELHLHPRVQSLLADFFLSMTLLGKQCIIETHSEYIIDRLRFRAAAAEDSTVSDLMKIYFVEKKGGQSTFRSVDVNKYGAIMDWPEGFFDQSQSEAEEILKAATKKHKAEKGK